MASPVSGENLRYCAPARGALPRRLSARLLASTAMLVVASAAYAADSTWTGLTDTEFSTGTNWDNGTPTVADHAIISGINPNTPSVSSAQSVTSLTIQANGQLVVANGGTLTVSGATSIGVASAGTLSINSGGALTSGSTLVGAFGTLANAGTVASVDNQAGGTFTQAATGVAGAVTNAGTGSAAAGSTIASLTNTAGTFTTAGTVSGLTGVSGGAVTNDGTLQGAVTVSGGTLTNNATLASTLGVSGGTVTNAAGGTVTGASTITGSGTLANAGTVASVDNQAGGTFTQAATGVAGAVTNAGTGSAAAGSTIASLTNTAGTFTTAGTVSGLTGVSGGAVTNDGTLQGAVTVSGGTLTNNATLASTLGVSGGTVTNAAGGTVTGASTITGSGTLANAGTVASVDNQTGGTFTQAATGVAGAVTNAGTGSAAAGSTIASLTNTAGTFTNSGTITGGVTVLAGLVENTLGGIIGPSSVRAGATLINSGTLGIVTTESGAIFINNATFLAADVVNIGTGSSGTTATISSLTNLDGTFSNSGRVNGFATVSGGTVTNHAGGSVGGTTTVSGTGVFINSGTLAAVVNDTGGSFSNLATGVTGAFTNSGTATNASGGTVASLTNNGGTFENSGRIAGPLVVNDGVVTLTATGLLSAPASTTTVNGGVLELGNTTQTQALLTQTGGVIQHGVMNVGTYRMSGGSLAAGTTISASSLIDLQQGVVDGLLTGNANLTKTSAGAVQLYAPTHYSGTTTVSDGTLELFGTNILPQNTALAVIGQGLLDMHGYSQTIASISGNGTIYLGSGDLTVGDANSTEFSGVIQGSGGLNKLGSGTLTLSGQNEYTGLTSINAGVLNVTGTIVGPTIVNAGTTLTGTGNIGPLTVRSSGIVSPGDGTPGSSLTANGNVVFNAGSTLNVTIDGLGNSTTLYANGMVTINGSTLNVKALQGSYQPSTRYLLVSATNGVQGQFGAVRTNLNFLTTEIDYAGGDVYFVTSTPRFVDGLPQNSSSYSAYSVLSSIAPESMPAHGSLALANLHNLDPVSAGRVLAVLSGEGVAGAQQASRSTARVSGTAVADRIGTLMGQGYVNTGGGGQSTESDDPAVRQAAAGTIASRFDQPDIYPLSIWMTPRRNFERSKSLPPNTSRTNLRTDSISGGIDYRVSESLFLGVSFGLSGNSFVNANLATTGGAFGGNVGVYGGVKAGDFYFSGLFSYARSQNKTYRTIFGIGYDEVQLGKFTSEQVAGRLEAGWRKDLDFATLGFFAGIDFSSSLQHAFRERATRQTNVSNVFGLSFDNQVSTSTRTSVGFSVSKDIDVGSGLKLVPSARIAWHREFEPKQNQSAHFSTLSSPLFAVASSPLPIHALSVSGGLTVLSHAGLSAEIRGNAEFARGHRSYGVTGGLRYIPDFKRPPRTTEPSEQNPAEPTPWSYSLTQELSIVSWKSNSPFPADGRFRKGSGYQIYMPYTLTASGKLGDDLRMDLDARTGPVRSHQTSPNFSGRYSGWTDTAVSSTLTYTGSPGFEPSLAINVNVPTGRSKNNLYRSRSKMDSDFVDLSSYGAGLNIGSTLGLKWNFYEQWFVNARGAYSHNGVYSSEGGYTPATGKLGRNSLQPSHSFSPTFSLGFEGEPVSGTVSITYIHNTLSYINGSPSSQPGDSLTYALQSRWKASDMFSFDFSGSYTKSEKSKAMNQETALFFRESANSASSLLRLELGQTTSIDKWTFGPYAGYTNRNKNSYSPQIFGFVPQKKMAFLGLRANYSWDDALTFGLDAQYFRAIQAAEPDKTAGGIVIAGTAVPKIKTTGFKSKLNVNLRF